MGREKKIVAAVLSILFFTSASLTYTSEQSTTVTRHKQEAALLSCPYQVCSRFFIHQKYLSLHLRLEHKLKKDFECDICKKTFPYRSGLNRHKSIHDGTNKVKCNLCGKILSRPDKLKRHQNSRNCQKQNKQLTPSTPSTPDLANGSSLPANQYFLLVTHALLLLPPK